MEPTPRAASAAPTPSQSRAFDASPCTSTTSTGASPYRIVCRSTPALLQRRLEVPPVTIEVGGLVAAGAVVGVLGLGGDLGTLLRRSRVVGVGVVDLDVDDRRRGA